MQAKDRLSYNQVGERDNSEDSFVADDGHGEETSSRRMGPAAPDGIEGTVAPPPPLSPSPDDIETEAEAILEAAQRRNAERRRNRLIIAVLATSLAVSLIVAASLWWGGGSSPDDAGAPPPAVTFGDDGRPVLPPLPNDLADVCSPRKTQSSGGWKTCYRYCAVAECCYLPASHGLSCLPGNEAQCATYESECMKLDVEIPPAPLDLPTICSEESLNDPTDGPANKGRCRDECHASLCCEEPVDSCRPLVHETCHQYWPCAALYGESVEQYENGGSLFLPSPPEDLKDICSEDSLNNGSVDMYRRCADACHDALCCQEPIEACRVLNPEVCDLYEGPCSALYGDTVDEFEASMEVPDPPDDLADRCSSESLSTAKGYKKCEKACHLAMCCRQPIEQCRVLDPEKCKLYGPCDILYSRGKDKYEGNVEVPPPPKGVNVADVCNAESVNTVEGFTECEDMCDRARCCDEAIEYCKVTNPSACDQYGICNNFFAFQRDGTIGPFETQNDAALLKLSEQIGSVCRDLTDPQGLAACQHLCNDRFCCFETMTDRNCAGEYQCVVFAACKVLFDRRLDGDNGVGIAQ